MPYITQDAREDVKPKHWANSPKTPINGGELNYLISSLCATYIAEHGCRYQNISDVVGALEGAKQEFFRKIVNPYEILKEHENGPIPEYNQTEKEIFSKICSLES